MSSLHNTFRHGSLVDVVDVLDRYAIQDKAKQHLCAALTNVACQLRTTQIKVDELQTKIKELENVKTKNS